MRISTIAIASAQTDYLLPTPKLYIDAQLRDKVEECHNDDMIDILGREHKCSPTAVKLPLVLPTLSNFTSILPNYITVTKCIGACQKYACIPSRQRTIIKTVIVNKCDQQNCSRSCKEVVIQEDLKCSCQCPVAICNTRIKTFDNKSCKCECKNMALKFRCLKEMHAWDERECICKPLSHQCEHGTNTREGTKYDLIISLMAILLGLIAIAVSVFVWLNVKYNQYVVASGQET